MRLNLRRLWPFGKKVGGTEAERALERQRKKREKDDSEFLSTEEGRQKAEAQLISQLHTVFSWEEFKGKELNRDNMREAFIARQNLKVRGSPVESAAEQYSQNLLKNEEAFDAFIERLKSKISGKAD